MIGDNTHMYLKLGKDWRLYLNEGKYHSNVEKLYNYNVDNMAANLRFKQRRGLKYNVLVHFITRGLAVPKTVINQSLSLKFGL